MIPLSVPYLTGNEKKYVDECINTNWISSVGHFVDEFEDSFAVYSGAAKAAAVSSGTAALHLSLIVSDIKRDDEVFVPSLTFIAPVNAVCYTGAHPVFIDCDRKSLGISPEALEEFVSEHCSFLDERLFNKLTGRYIKALIAVNILGHSCMMDELVAFSSKYGLTLIEDDAEGAGCLYKGRHLGSFGRFGCFSFNGNKTMTTGGGGMAVSSEKEEMKLLKHLSTQAKTDDLYYSHDMIGYNYRMSNIQAAIGLAQLENLENMIARKREIHAVYERELVNIPGAKLFVEQPWCRSNCWFALLLLPRDKRDLFMKFMTEKGIQTRPFWKLNHLHPMFQDCARGKTPAAAELWERGACFPCFQGMTDADVEKVVQSIKIFFKTV
ncbi:MAG: hypothetical protein A2020_06340 [Lentisphaerae bacterium GWF2_45_14]|nr:MAG: hypothetical protein A2020_06340 [Lentisphaerae bacterium GWF2_45_14]